MKRGALCSYGVFDVRCNNQAVRTVKQKPYCEKHAEIMERIYDRKEKDKKLLERLKDD